MGNDTTNIILALMIILGAFGAIACLICAIVSAIYRRFLPGLLGGMVFFAIVFVIGVRIASPDLFPSYITDPIRGTSFASGNGGLPGATVSSEGAKKFINQYYPEYKLINQMIEDVTSGSKEYTEDEVMAIMETMDDNDSEVLYNLVTLCSKVKNTSAPNTRGARDTVEAYLKELCEDQDQGIRFIDVSDIMVTDGDRVTADPIILPAKLLNVITSAANVRSTLDRFETGKIKGEILAYDYSFDFVEELPETTQNGVTMYAAKYKLKYNVTFAPIEGESVGKTESHETLLGVAAAKYSYGWRIIEFTRAY